jgi:DNA-binding GntR family transcriptional regulator
LSRSDRNEPLADVHGALQARLIAALEARDGARPAQSLAAHMRNTWERVRDSM